MNSSSSSQHEQNDQDHMGPLDMDASSDEEEEPFVRPPLIGTPTSMTTTPACLFSSSTATTNISNNFVRLEDLKCMISLQLPIDPVVTCDGMIYERASIEQWLTQSDRSPATNLPLKTKALIPSWSTLCQIQIVSSADENSIKLLSKDDQALLEDWKLRYNAKNVLANLTHQATTQQNVDAMEELGANYYGGWNGFPQDGEKAYFWNKMAADQGSIEAMALAGEYLVSKHTNKSSSSLMISSTVMITMAECRDKVLGISLLTTAANQEGSDFACIVLGKIFAGGLEHMGLPEDRAQAIRLLTLGTSGDCLVRQAGEELIEEGKKKLEELRSSLPS